jgi:low affinity Fe/Cu permease
LTAYFEQFSRALSNALGAPTAFVLAVILVLAWAATGPLFEWSDTHQLLINTATTIATFLMLFLLQSTQNRDTAAFHVKLDEILAALPFARTGLGQAEEMSREELEQLRAEMVRRAKAE